MSATIVSHRLQNVLRSALLLSALASVTALVGWLVGGWVGVALSAALAIVITLMTPLGSAERLLRTQGARRLSAPWLEAEVGELARRAGLGEPPALWLVPMPMPQAITISGAGSAAIALTPSLLRSLAPREIVAVLAHEISHLRHRDLGWMRIAQIARAVTQAGTRAGLFLVLLSLPLVLLGQASVAWLAVLALVAAPWVVRLLTLALSRAREHDADAGAVALTGDPIALASALRRIEATSRPWWHTFLRFELPEHWRTHPHTERRVARLLAMARAQERRGAEPLSSHPFADGAQRAREGADDDHDDRPRVLVPEWRRMSRRHFV